MNDIQVWAETRSSDQIWHEQVATLPAGQLRRLLPMLEASQRAAESRAQYVQMLLDLEPAPQCDCDRRWTATNMVHEPDCKRRTACTCDRQWLGGGARVEDHASNCALRANEDTGQHPRIIMSEPAPREQVMCRKCDTPITGYAFGSESTGWEHMVGECLAQEDDSENHDDEDDDQSPAEVDSFSDEH